jgi:hypothetical protein
MNNILSQPRVKWLLIPALCLMVGALDVLRGYLQMLSLGQSYSWQDCLPIIFFYFGVWALAAPLVIGLAERFRIELENWGRRLCGHALLAVAIGLAVRLAVEIFLFNFYAPPEATFNPQNALVTALSKIAFDVFAYFIILIIYHAFEFLQRFQSEQLRAAQLQSALMQAELRGLMTQFHPDFLLNAHEAVIARMQRLENERAILLLTQLGDLLRKMLEQAGETGGAIQKELELFEVEWSIKN